MFQHAVMAVKAYISTTVPAGPERTVALGRVGVAYGLGMVVGPSIGGLLGGLGLRYAAVFAAAVSAVSALSVALLLGEAQADGAGAPAAAAAAGAAALAAAAAPGGGVTPSSSSSTPAGGSGGYLALLSLPGVRTAYAIRVVLSLALALFHSAFSLLAAERFGLDAAGTGRLLSWVGALGVFANVALVPWVVASRLSAASRYYAAGVALAVSLALFSVIEGQLALFALCVPQALAMSLISTLAGSELSAMTGPALQGAVTAFDMSVGSTTRLITPALAAVLIRTAGASSIGLVCSLAAGGAVALLARSAADHRPEPSKAEVSGAGDIATGTPGGLAREKKAS